MAFFTMGMPWNEGEEKMHKLLQVPSHDNPTAQTLTPQGAYMLQRAPLLAIGTLDCSGRPWTSIWGGQPGFSEPLGGGMVGTRTIVDAAHDPVIQAFGAGNTRGKMTPGNDKMFSALSIDLMTRKRVKLFGRLLATNLEDVDVEVDGDDEPPKSVPRTQEQLQLVTKIEQSLGNCPKYLNQYQIQPALVQSKLLAVSKTLIPEAKELIMNADMFFLSSATQKDMDTNHRGGEAGFVRILSDTEIVYPEYSGNRLYQTLGNLQMNPKVGLVFPDYTTGDVAYMTGEAEILVQSAAAEVLPGSNLAVKIRVDEVRVVQFGLPFRGVRKSPSPYNPLVRLLRTEGNIKAAYSNNRSIANLIDKVEIAPTIARFRFSLSDSLSYTPSQWVALDFSKELDIGYSHMRDDDPKSLNDDFVRTFTIASRSSDQGDAVRTFDIVIRKVGPVTKFLFDAAVNGSLQVPVLGVGGDFKIQKPANAHRIGFVAGGVGITPLLSQLPTLLAQQASTLRLYWSVRAEDIPLVVHVLLSYKDLAQMTHLFLTTPREGAPQSDALTVFEDQGLRVHGGRMLGEHLEGTELETWYVCASRPFRDFVVGCLPGKRVVFEDFNY
ncbi:oxidoreductase-like protein [Sporormia fimetaria CBS 119925]|uniref:Oxidoreductase-like protein n=1 Tax=Sporormia fimetaria CBS 119925 TaxID=1340428 RepID=A0A6A6V7S6_9PLEO|nr:oxidoreductase-like protein [Sporormia fimetaria CBS 119925]